MREEDKSSNYNVDDNNKQSMQQINQREETSPLPGSTRDQISLDLPSVDSNPRSSGVDRLGYLDEVFGVYLAKVKT